jgi:hypothetical protein
MSDNARLMGTIELSDRRPDERQKAVNRQLAREIRCLLARPCACGKSATVVSRSIGEQPRSLCATCAADHAVNRQIASQREQVAAMRSRRRR